MKTELAQQKNQAPANAVRAEYVRPYYEVYPSDHAYDIHVHLPGVLKNDASITLENDQLTIEGSKGPLAPESWIPVMREIPTVNYRLVLDLNVDVDGDKIAATAENGILKVHLPVAEAARPRRIEVS
jgi:HSP20 family protein